jgi:hypothetical protein
MKKLIVLLVLAVTVLTSCSSGRKGYGCRGNMSWDRMMWKNTRP